MVPAVHNTENHCPYLKLLGISKVYGETVALSDLSVDVPENAIFGIIGPDGAGKSTLMKIAVRLQNPDTGSLTPATGAIYQPGGIGYMPQEFSLYPDLTVKENLRFFADLYHITGELRRERYNRMLEFSRLTAFTDRRAENLSGGMRQKLALICVLMFAPPLLILDEPTTGVDPMARAELWEMLHQLREEGWTILVSTPYMEEAVQCDEVLFLSHGKKLAHNKPKELQNNYTGRLFELRTDDIMKALDRLEEESWIHLIYPKGDKLHLSIRDSSLEQSQIHTMLETSLGEKLSLERITPGMEDVYAALEGSE